MAGQTRERLRKHLRDIQVKRSYIESAKELVGKRRRQINKKEESVRTDINRLVDTWVLEIFYCLIDKLNFSSTSEDIVRIFIQYDVHSVDCEFILEYA